jgi:hypothetical protein
VDMYEVPRATVGGGCTCVNNGTVAAATGLLSSDSLAGLSHYGSVTRRLRAPCLRPDHTILVVYAQVRIVDRRPVLASSISDLQG